MGDELLLYYVFIFTGILIFFGSVHDGFRVQRQKGIISESWVMPLLLFMGWLVQPMLWLNIFEMEPIIYILILSLAAFIYLAVHIYRKGRVFVIHETSKNILLERVRTELNHYSISYNEKEIADSKKVIFTLLDEDAVIKVSWRGEEKQFQTFRLSFKKWWRIYYYEEIKENIKDFFKEERDGKVFWKQILTNAGTGVFILGTMIFLFFTIKP